VRKKRTVRNNNIIEGNSSGGNMKKKIFLLHLMLLALNVEAKTVYTDYTFIGYSETSEEYNELVKYEETKLNKFYTLEEVNIVYEDSNKYIDQSPFIDYDDFTTTAIYSLSKENDNYNYYALLKTNNTYSTNKIYFRDFNTGSGANKVYEIEVYYDDIKVEYEADYYSWLNDGIKNEGSRLEGHDFTLTLDDFYDITKLKIVIYHRNEVDSRTYLFIEYVNDNGSSLSKMFDLDNSLNYNLISSIRVLTRQDSVDFLVSNNLMSEDEADFRAMIIYYVYENTLYKHYNLNKTYGPMIEDDILDGYMFDKEESISVYKVYKREIMFEIEDQGINENTINDDEIDLLKSTSESVNNQNKLEEVEEANEIKVSNDKKTIKETEEYIPYRVIPVKRKEDVNSKTINKTIEESKDEKIESYPNSTDSTDYNKENTDFIYMLLIIIIALIVVITIYNIIHIIYEKFTDNNR